MRTVGAVYRDKKREFPGRATFQTLGDWSLLKERDFSELGPPPPPPPIPARFAARFHQSVQSIVSPSRLLSAFLLLSSQRQTPLT